MGLFLPRLPDIGRPERPLGSFAGATVAHIGLIATFALAVPPETIRQALQPMAVRIVELMPEKPRPEKPPEIPRPSKKSPPPAMPLLTAQAPVDTPASFTVPPQPPAPTLAPPISVAPSLSPPPVTMTAARFDADYLDNPKPVYPNASRRLGEQGKVLLRVYVSAQGLAEKVELKLGSGFARLDQAAQDAVARWRFVPARRGDEAVSAWVQVPITFQLDS
jgi:protein TonB